jgi:hypothetical protein
MAQVAEAAKHHAVEIKVNDSPVAVEGPRTTGLQIKEAAIAQGVKIEVTFELSEELGDRKTKVIGNDDPVTVHEGLEFLAVAGDDNS